MRKVLLKMTEPKRCFHRRPQILHALLGIRLCSHGIRHGIHRGTRGLCNHRGIRGHGLVHGNLPLLPRRGSLQATPHHRRLVALILHHCTSFVHHVSRTLACTYDIHHAPCLFLSLRQPSLLLPHPPVLPHPRFLQTGCHHVLGPWG